MPLEKQSKHPEWYCVDFDYRTYVLNNVFTKPAGGEKPRILRLVRSGDLWMDTTEIDLSFIGIERPLFYVLAKPDEIIKDKDLFWFYNGNDTPVKMYVSD